MIKNSFTEYLYKVHSIVDVLSNWDLSSQLEQVEATYSTMLRYMNTGVVDPNAKEMISHLWSTAIGIEIKALRFSRMKQQPNNQYCVAARANRADTQILACLDIAKSGDYQDKDIITLFNTFWTSGAWTSSQTDQILDFISSDDTPSKVKSILISAITLAATEYFDPQKLLCLFNCYLNDDVEASQRALVGLIIIIRQHDHLIGFYPEITAWIDSMSNDDIFVQQFYSVLTQLQMSALTETTSNKIREDIMPQIKFASKKTRAEMGFLEISKELSINGENPEWIEPEDTDIEDPKAVEEAERRAQEKMREMADMQLEGEDIYMANFCYLKRFPFFSQLPHWFYPFTMDEPCIHDTLSHIGWFNDRLQSILFNGSPFCNSDKFSFLFIAEMLGEEGLNNIKEQLESTVESIEEEQKDAIIEAARQRSRRAKHVARCYIFDLYRFYMVHQYHSEFYSPFADKSKQTFSPLHTRTFAPLLQHKEHLLTFADFLIRKQLYADALAILSLDHLNTEVESAKFWQKKGFCYHRLGESIKAKECFIKADNLKPHSRWTLSHLAKAAMKTADYREAMDCYQQLMDIDSENTGYMFHYADCCMKMHKYSKALQVLYKANYLSPDNTAITQSIVRCLIIKNDKEKALAYATDGISKGVLLTDLGNIPEAIQQFRAVYQQNLKDNKPASALISSINEFTSGLKNINTDIISLVHDAAILDS